MKGPAPTKENLLPIPPERINGRGRELKAMNASTGEMVLTGSMCI
jgi:hypothetical protein